MKLRQIMNKVEVSRLVVGDFIFSSSKKQAFLNISERDSQKTSKLLENDVAGYIFKLSGETLRGWWVELICRNHLYWFTSVIRECRLC